jgi:hypothetical protein
MFIETILLRDSTSVETQVADQTCIGDDLRDPCEKSRVLAASRPIDPADLWRFATRPVALLSARQVLTD